MRKIEIDLLSHFVDRNEEISERKNKITLGRRKILYYIIQVAREDSAIVVDPDYVTWTNHEETRGEPITEMYGRQRTKKAAWWNEQNLILSMINKMLKLVLR